MVGGLENRNADEGGYDSDLIDVTSMSLREVIESDDSVLGNAIRRIVAESAAGQNVVAGHGNGVT